MRRRRERLALNADINVVSLIDVMMLLMVIFMITAPLMTGGVDLTLPAADARPLEDKSGLTVSVTRDGAVYVDETRFTFEQFRGAFAALASQRGAASGGVYVRADAGAPYGAVARVLGVITASGVTNVGLVTEPEGGT